MATLIRYNLPPLELNPLYISSDNGAMLIETPEGDKIGYLLKLEDEQGELVCYRDNVGVWHIPCEQVDRITAEPSYLKIWFKNGKPNVCTDIELK